MVVAICGKARIACLALAHAVNVLDGHRLVACPVRSDPGYDTWQPSLVSTAHLLDVELASVGDLETVEDLLLISLEYDRILAVDQFRSQRLFNIHFSALPRYRGVFTSIWPILNGERESGVTLHRIDPGVDSGAIVAQRIFPLSSQTTSRDLYDLYLDEGIVLFREWFTRLLTEVPDGTPQDESLVCYYDRKSLDLSAVEVDLNQPADEICRFVRAFAFPEYQLPTVAGRAVRSCGVVPGRQNTPAGSLLHQSPVSTTFVVGEGQMIEAVWA
jgi:methionyl-tRNA formyltransferase